MDTIRGIIVVAYMIVVAVAIVYIIKFYTLAFDCMQKYMGV